MGQVQERETVISNLTESLSKAELQLTLSVEDFKKEVETLRETLQQAEDERDKYQALSEKQHTQHERSLEETQERLQEKIRELEDQLEEKEEQLQTTINEIDQNSQQQLAELKKFWHTKNADFTNKYSLLSNKRPEQISDLSRIEAKNQ